MNGINPSITLHGVTFTGYPHDSAWNHVPGIYLFGGDGTRLNWPSFAYIGKSDDLAERIGSHDQWKPAVRLGATHVYVAVIPDTTARHNLEALLIKQFDPPLNRQQPTLRTMFAQALVR